MGTLVCYTARTMTGRRRDVRDEKAEQIQRLLKATIKATLTDPSTAQRAADAVLPDKAAFPLPNWPTPSVVAKRMATLAVRDAIPRVRRGAELLGQTRLDSPWPGTPEPEIQFQADPPDQAVFRAPLVYECLEGAAGAELACLLAFRFSNRAPEIRSGGGDKILTRWLNAYLRLEIELWRTARKGGYPYPPPYAVRYETARWLWSPEIAGFAFCLRCGSELSFRRAARSESTRNLRCGACSRDKDPSNWPDYAICPAERGTWWLRCRADGCSNAFVGHTQARRCPYCRSSRLTPARRKPLTSS